MRNLVTCSRFGSDNPGLRCRQPGHVNKSGNENDPSRSEQNLYLKSGQNIFRLTTAISLW